MPRQSGYDPVERFLVPKSPAMTFKILAKLPKKELGSRMLMDVIPLNATLVKGSHGVRPARVADYPIAIADRPSLREGRKLSPRCLSGMRRLVVGDRAPKLAHFALHQEGVWRKIDR